MLKNFWYVCEFSSAVTNKPKQILMLNQRFVLYRNSQGQVVALKDQCPHRGAALSLGWVEDGCLRCPYHGWKFKADGKCIDIPANAPEMPIPKKARVDSYSVQEKYGLVWLFYGDLPPEKRPPIPYLPEFADPKMRSIVADVKVNTHYTRVIENALDLAHVYIVHGNSVGAGLTENPRIETYQVHEEEWGIRATTKFVNFTKPKGLFRPFFRAKRTELTTTTSFYLPNITKVEVDFGRGKLINYAAHLPIDNQTTLSKRVQFRNFFTYPWADGLCRNYLHRVSQEDSRVSESQYPQAIPDNLSADVHIPSDALSLAYRKLRQQYLAMGWGLDANPNDFNNGNGHSVLPDSPAFVNLSS